MDGLIWIPLVLFGQKEGRQLRRRCPRTFLVFGGLSNRRTALRKVRTGLESAAIRFGYRSASLGCRLAIWENNMAVFF